MLDDLPSTAPPHLAASQRFASNNISPSHAHAAPSQATAPTYTTSVQGNETSGYSGQSRAIGWHRTSAGSVQNPRPPIGISSAPTPASSQYLAQYPAPAAPAPSQFSSAPSIQPSQYYPRQGAPNEGPAPPGARKRSRVDSTGASARFLKVKQHHIRVIIDCLAVRGLFYRLIYQLSMFKSTCSPLP